jgi:hypothetical protein
LLPAGRNPIGSPEFYLVDGLSIRNRSFWIRLIDQRVSRSGSGGSFDHRSCRFQSGTIGIKAIRQLKAMKAREHSVAR